MARILTRRASALALRVGLWAAILVALVLTLFAWPAAAQQGRCGPRDEAITKLETDYRERRIGMGATQDGRAVFELYVSDSGTWTILVTDTRGTSCIHGAGVGWTAEPVGEGI